MMLFLSLQTDYFKFLVLFFSKRRGKRIIESAQDYHFFPLFMPYSWIVMRLHAVMLSPAIGYRPDFTWIVLMASKSGSTV